MIGYTTQEHQRNSKPLQECTLLDDHFFMAVLMDNKQGIQDILRVILDKPDLIVEQAEIQGPMQNLKGRSLIMDVVAKDSHGNRFNIEVQNDNSGANPKRARYHMALLDSVSLQPNQSLNDLPENFVIFITRNDVLGGNLPIYHIERIITEIGAFFDDFSHIIYVNCSWKLDAQEEEMKTPLEKLISDLRCAEPAKMNFKSLSETAQSLKSNPKGEQLMIDDVYQEGVQTGWAKGREELLKQIEEDNLSAEQIKELLAKEIEANPN